MSSDRDAHLKNVEQDDCSRASDLLVTHPLQPPFEARLIPLDNTSSAEEPHDARTRLKGTEHDRYAAIFKDMGDGLVAGTGSIDVAAEIGIKYAE